MLREFQRQVQVSRSEPALKTPTKSPSLRDPPPLTSPPPQTTPGAGEGSGPLGYYPFGNGSGSVPSSPGAVQYDRDATPSPAGRRMTPGSLTPRSGADSPASGFLTPGLAGLARLHGALLERGYVRAPLEDLQALVGLLSLPLEAAVAPAAGPGESPLAAQALPEPLLLRGDVAASYACAVLDAAGRMLLCLGERSLKAMSEHPNLALGHPRLRARVQRALEETRSAQLRTEKVYSPSASPSRARVGSVGRAMLPHGETRPRGGGAEEQRRCSNRELVRDAFCAVLRDHSPDVNTFLAFSASTLNGPYPAEARREGFQGDLRAYESLQRAAARLLQGLRPDNYAWFAELLVARFSLAAVAGEADDELMVLAKHDTEKMHKLQQRLSGPAEIKPGRPGGVTPPASRPGQQGGFGRGAQRAPGSSTTPSGWRDSSAGGGKGASNAMHSASNLAAAATAAFPMPLRFYVLFVAVADSGRLNSCLSAHIMSRLEELHQTLGSTKEGRQQLLAHSCSERILEVRALGSLLGYITFGHSCDDFSRPWAPAQLSGYDASPAQLQLLEPWKRGSWQLLGDVPKILESAKETGSLIVTAPWVVEYLRFMNWSPGAASSWQAENCFRALKSLYSVPYVNPHFSEFTRGGLCVRAVLDTFLSSCGLDNPAANPSDDNVLEGSPRQTVGDLGFLDQMEGLVDTRCMQACCPQLEELALVMQVRQVALIRSVRKIRPTNPNSAEGGVTAPALDMPDFIKTALNEATETQKSLEGTFLEQYPALKLLIDFVVDTIAANSLTKALERLDPSVSERPDASVEALRDCFSYCQSFIAGNVSSALRSLASPSVPEEAVDVACHLAYNAALASSAASLREKIPARVASLQRGLARKSGEKGSPDSPGNGLRARIALEEYCEGLDAACWAMAPAQEPGPRPEPGVLQAVHQCYVAVSRSQSGTVSSGARTEPSRLLYPSQAGLWRLDGDPFALTFFNAVAVCRGWEEDTEAARAQVSRAGALWERLLTRWALPARAFAQGLAAYVLEERPCDWQALVAAAFPRSPGGAPKAALEAIENKLRERAGPRAALELAALLAPSELTETAPA